MKRALFLGIAIAFCCSVASPPVMAKDVGTPVFTIKDKQVYQAPIVVQLDAYDVCALADVNYILISPTQATHGVAVVPAKVSVPVAATKVSGGPPRSRPPTYAYDALYSNRFSNCRCNGNRLCHIDPGLRGC